MIVAMCKINCCSCNYSNHPSECPIYKSFLREFLEKESNSEKTSRICQLLGVSAPSAFVRETSQRWWGSRPYPLVRQNGVKLLVEPFKPPARIHLEHNSYNGTTVDHPLEHLKADILSYEEFMDKFKVQEAKETPCPQARVDLKFRHQDKTLHHPREFSITTMRSKPYPLVRRLTKAPLRWQMMTLQ